MSDTALAVRESEEVRSLRIECDTLRRKLERAEEERDNLYDALQRAKDQSAAANRAIGGLRKILQPMFNGLRAVFGELDAADIEGSGETSNPKSHGVWESWKQKLGGKSALTIQALLEHGEMNVAQIRVATHSAQQTVYETMSKLHKLGLINKNGGRYSLKTL